MDYRGVIIGVLALLPACAVDNPLYGYGVLESSEADSEGPDDDDDDDAVSDGDDDDDDDDDDASDGGSVAELCTGALPGEFGLDLTLSQDSGDLCTGIVSWSCTLHHENGWVLNECCIDEGCETPFAEIPLAFHAEEPDPAFAGLEIQFNAFLTAGPGWCSASWVEMVSPTESIPLYAGATTHSAQFETLSVMHVEPKADERCACSEESTTCCQRPAGPYEVAFNLAAFAEDFIGVTLAQEEVWDTPIGDFGHAYIEVFSAFRDSGCERDLKVDWVLKLVAE